MLIVQPLELIIDAPFIEQSDILPIGLTAEGVLRAPERAAFARRHSNRSL